MHPHHLFLTARQVGAKGWLLLLTTSAFVFLSKREERQIGHIAHDVFAYAFIDAMRPTLAVPILALALGAVSCLAVRSGRREAAARTEEVPEAVA